MKKLIAFLLILCLSVGLLACDSSNNKTATNTTFAYSEDYARGYDDGYFDGYFAAVDANGMDTSDGDYDEGYADGNRDGYYEGATYTCLFFGDVDRAIRSAYKGSAWYTFIDAYDQYISNIYDDSETRSTLFWAFVSATISEDATDEEIDLLYSTFGKELFTRNDISLNP